MPYSVNLKWVYIIKLIFHFIAEWQYLYVPLLVYKIRFYENSSCIVVNRWRYSSAADALYNTFFLWRLQWHVLTTTAAVTVVVMTLDTDRYSLSPFSRFCILMAYLGDFHIPYTTLSIEKRPLMWLFVSNKVQFTKEEMKHVLQNCL